MTRDKFQLIYYIISKKETINSIEIVSVEPKK